LQRLARLGAERRLQELRAEEAAIRAAFPDLARETGPGAKRGRPRGRRGAKQSAESGGNVQTTQRTAKRRGYKMTAAQKKAVSERMKKYWASRKAKGKG
jgi:hypothetical protein